MKPIFITFGTLKPEKISSQKVRLQTCSPHMEYVATVQGKIQKVICLSLSCLEHSQMQVNRLSEHGNGNVLDFFTTVSVSYTHLTLPTNREV